MNNPVRIIVLAFAVFLVYVGISVVINLGVFKDPVLLGEKTYQMDVVYKKIVGPYYKVGEAFPEVENSARSFGLACKKTFGLYLDDPEVVDEDRLRAHIGCLISESEVPKKGDGGLILDTLGPGKALVITFDGSPASGPFKVYPLAKDWFLKNSKPMFKSILEVYVTKEDGSFLTGFIFQFKTSKLAIHLVPMRFPSTELGKNLTIRGTEAKPRKAQWV
ncbi:MAG: GyrI-like domain-containing protein [Bdellovibrionales bacterium]